MSSRGVRIVVGEGPSTRKGLLRFVLDGEGYDVVAEAATTAELARLMATHRPDVVVLDDGIGATAVGMINEMSPNTKVVLVWPGAVVPIGGAARVEPSRVLEDLGPTVERLTGQTAASASGRAPALLEGAANDPDMLSAMLLGGEAAFAEPIIEDREPAPVVILPLTPSVDHDELILNVPEADGDDERRGVRSAGVLAAGAMLASATPAAAETGGGTVIPLAAGAGRVGAQSALNRRLGNMALAGAAVASALVLALALGGTRVPIGGVSGQAPVPSVAQPFDPIGANQGTGSGPDGSGDPTTPGGGGSDDPRSADADLTRSTEPPVTVDGDTPPSSVVPDVGVDTGDPGSGPDDPDDDDDGDGGNGIDGGGSSGGGDDHAGGDSGDHDSGGGNDRDGDDPDNGGGNDGDDGDHDQGGGNDDPDNPSNSGGGNGGGNGNGDVGGNNGNGDGGGTSGGGDGGGSDGGGSDGGGNSGSSAGGAGETGSGGGDGAASDGGSAAGGEGDGSDER